MPTTAMLETHPRRVDVDAGQLARTIDVLVECAATCTQCADACLSEPDLSSELAPCIHHNLDCADICTATSRVVSRRTDHDAGVTRAQLEACAAACARCGEECEQHAAHMEHCRVCSETWSDKPCATLDVLDEGPGISPELAATLFDRFSSSADSKGLGLGLHISRRIARVHHGDLTAHPRPGGGTRFRLTLPLDPS